MWSTMYCEMHVTWNKVQHVAVDIVKMIWNLLLTFQILSFALTSSYTELVPNSNNNNNNNDDD